MVEDAAKTINSWYHQCMAGGRRCGQRVGGRAVATEGHLQIAIENTTSTSNTSLWRTGSPFDSCSGQLARSALESAESSPDLLAHFGDFWDQRSSLDKLRHPGHPWTGPPGWDHRPEAESDGVAEGKLELRSNYQDCQGHQRSLGATSLWNLLCFGPLLFFAHHCS